MTFFNRPPHGASWCGICGTVLDLPASPKPWPWRLKSQEDLLAYLGGLSDEPEEWLLCFYVSTDLRLIAVEPPFRGTADHVLVDCAQLICRAKQLESNGFILVHNHPSGTPRPSVEDIAVSEKLRRISTELDVPLLDHFILTGNKLVRISEWL